MNDDHQASSCVGRQCFVKAPAPKREYLILDPLSILPSAANGKSNTNLKTEIFPVTLFKSSAPVPSNSLEFCPLSTPLEAKSSPDL